jgi:muramidase (phage lysozyme)
MFNIYQKNGTWKVREIPEIFFLTKEQTIEALIQIAANSGVQEFEITVEESQPSYPSPYEWILGFQICNKCALHPCEC